MTEETMHTLSNGLRVAVAPMPHVETTSVGVWVDIGARHEREEENGLAHMLEHMAFKGTARRSALQIAEEIEGAGGYINAYTSREQTAYYARVLKDDLELAVDLIADIVLASTFPEEELRRERDVIRQEIAQVNDTPDDVIFDNLQAAAFPGQAVGRSILGRPERVGAFRRDELRTFMDRGYDASRLVVAAAGAVDPDDFLKLAEARFGHVPARTMAPPEPARWHGGSMVDERKIEQVHLALGIDGVDYHDADFTAVQVMSNLLGGGMSSRLFQEVRERRGLAYSVFSFAGSMVDGGMIGVYAATDPEQLGELVPVLAEEIRRVAHDAAEEETARSRAQIKAGMVMSLESSAARLEQLARQVLIYGAPQDVGEWLARVDAVDAAGVRRVAHRLFEHAPDPAVAAIGPARLEDHDRLRARFR
ncbi:MAG: peptidase M16 [Rhizobiales bacterium NRL2]|jgi:predicted Zn-dependent peptidase|nr:MAG: peptidase M16 [Rhizobiales bacterium NRL2]